MNTRIGVGVIGLGSRGRLHAQAYREAAALRLAEPDPQPRLMNASDAYRGTCLEAVVSLGFRRSTPEYREVLEDPDVHAVSICVPDDLSREVALAAVAAGKPFWIDGPTEQPSAQWREIALAAEQAGLVTAVRTADGLATGEQAARFLRSVVTGEQLSPSLADTLLPAADSAYTTS